MLQPAADVPALGVVMGPVYDAALVVPLVLAVELDRIAHLEPFHARGEIDVVGDEQRPATGDLHDEALVPAAVVVVGQYACYDARTADLFPAPRRDERFRLRVTILRGERRALPSVLRPSQPGAHEQQADHQQLFHGFPRQYQSSARYNGFRSPRTRTRAARRA